MAVRYQDSEFTIFAVRVTNFAAIEQEVGVVRLLELIDEYVVRVKAQLRTTDLTSLGGNDDIWFLLPKTDVQQRQIVIDRILDAKLDALPRESNTGLDFRIVALTIPGECSEHDTPEKIITALQQELKAK